MPNLALSESALYLSGALGGAASGAIIGNFAFGGTKNGKIGAAVGLIVGVAAAALTIQGLQSSRAMLAPQSYVASLAPLPWNVTLPVYLTLPLSGAVSGAALAWFAAKKSQVKWGALLGAVFGLGLAVVVTQPISSQQYSLTPKPPIQLVPSQNSQAYAPLVVSGQQAGGAYIF